MRRALLAAALAALCLLSACTAQRPTTAFTAPDALPQAADLNTALANRRDSVHSVRALARLHYRDPDAANTSREAIAVARPDRLRVEVLSFFGAVFVLTTDNGRFTAYARREETIYRGEASPENMWSYARIGLPVVDLVDIMLGTPPQRNPDWSQVSWDPERGWIELTQEFSNGAEQVVWFLGTLPAAAEFRDPFGEVQWHATFGGYEDHDGIPIATRIRLEVPSRDRSVEIELNDVDVNPTLDDSTFALEVPNGVRVVDIETAESAD
jgi:outer membrane lipoprotein-sorting protein